LHAAINTLLYLRWHRYLWWRHISQPISW